MNFDRIENTIENVYKEVEDNLNDEFIGLYAEFNNFKIQMIFSTIHYELINLFKAMNTRLPTTDNEGYYWAQSSRDLIKCIDLIYDLKNKFQNTIYAFSIDSYYDSILSICKTFLSQTLGSTIPPHMKKIELYYTIPIFRCNQNVAVKVSIPYIKAIDREYITNMTSRALMDIENSNFDSALTKSRTLVEETFCYVIELRNEIPDDSGNVKKLYNQVKQLYNMHQDQKIDKRINMLLSGLEKILTSISEMRNELSDSHGVGQKRIQIEEHHARLFVNSAMIMADFILSIGYNYQKQKIN